MSAGFLAGVVAGYGIAVPVGAIGVLIAGLSARVSLRVGAAAGLGAATADGLYALVAVAGGAAIASLITPIATPLRAYLGILGLTLLNPATVVYFAALVLGRGGAGGGVWFVAGAFLASASWQLVIAGGGSLVGRLLTGERGRLITALTSSAVIAALALQMVVG